MLIAGNKKDEELKLVCPYGGLVSGVENYLKEKDWRRKSSGSDKKTNKKKTSEHKMKRDVTVNK